MNLHLDISAGEFFDLIRPAFLAISILLSTWVFFRALKLNFRIYAATAWAVGTLLFLPFVLPLFLLAQRRAQSVSFTSKTRTRPSRRLWLTLLYCSLAVVVVSIYFYRDYSSVDAHLARAAQAKVANQRARAIREYRAALQLEDNAHTHKLLGIELADEGKAAEALREFRLAEQGSEPDDLLSFRLAAVLQDLNQKEEARKEYERFLKSALCTQSFPDNKCTEAKARIADLGRERD